jgi:hypothetical protein
MRIVPRVALTVALLAIAAACGYAVVASYDWPGFAAVHLACLIVPAACVAAVMAVWPADGVPIRSRESRIADVRRLLRGMIRRDGAGIDGREQGDDR